jgi:S-DNA-T family DNA segregation ATPase FtsK/SpoIIIE
MSRTDERQAALRFCLVALGWLACLLGWVSIVSFNVADAPSTTVWPNSAPTRNLCGTVGAWVAYQAFTYFGVATYPLLFFLNAAVVAASKRNRLKDRWLRFLGLALICTATATFGTLLLGTSDRYLLSGPGGVLGTATAALLLPNLQMFGTVLLLSLALVVGLVLAADNLLMAMFRWLRWAQPSRASNGPVRPPRDWGGSDQAGAIAAEVVAMPPGQAGGRGTESQDLKTAPPPIVRPMSPERPPRTGSTRSGPGSPADEAYELPPVKLLARGPALDKTAIERSCREKAYVLEQTLNEFRLAVEVVAIETGPVITVFELRLAPGIKVSQIASLSNDMARALKAPAVRVVAPLPGKSTIGIEVPNIDKEKVRLRDVMELSASRLDHLAIPLFLGKDAAGEPLVTDLTRMPHLLIAGTTGSGKSVCISSLITSILMTRAPSEINLILLDPKVVELAAYKDIPHLICPIVTEIAKAEAILDWASTKMDERYALLAEAGVKDIRSYNRLGYDALYERLQPATDEEMDKIPVRLPYIVIIVDELADLMMSAAKEVEFYLCRIAQKSRAVGIHLIVSTQRPQATVVTGLIKSNLPSRIAFRVSSRLDSRIVLDQNGAEVLMGQGDMLFLPPGSSKLVRAQGTFVDDDELRAVVRHCRQQRTPRFHPELVRLPGADGEGGVGERDELFDQAVDIIVETGRGSVSLLQRRLTIGYGRASRLIDQMYAAGIVGEYKGSQAREVLLTKDEWETLKRQRDREEAEEAAESKPE